MVKKSKSSGKEFQLKLLKAFSKIKAQNFFENLELLKSSTILELQEIIKYSE